MTALRAIRRLGAVRFSRNNDRFELLYILLSTQSLMVFCLPTRQILGRQLGSRRR